MTVDWHEIAVGSAGVLFAVGGWAWLRVISQLDKIEARQDQHIEADRIEFGRVYERIGTEIRALDARVDNRFIARDRA